MKVGLYLSGIPVYPTPLHTLNPVSPKPYTLIIIPIPYSSILIPTLMVIPIPYLDPNYPL